MVAMGVQGCTDVMHAGPRRLERASHLTLLPPWMDIDCILTSSLLQCTNGLVYQKETNLVIENLFPKTVTNEYRGAWIAKWVLIAVTAMTLGRSLAHVFLPDGGAQSIATIPLDAYSPGASKVVIGMFAQWGLTQLMFGLLYVLVLWRYQSLLPVMWLFVLFEWTGRLLLGFVKPFETAGTAPGAVGNLIIPVLALVMFVLSLRTQRNV
jgi:hypothetical protein